MARLSIPRLATWLTRSGMRLAPSRREYSECVWRWTKLIHHKVDLSRNVVKTFLDRVSCDLVNSYAAPARGGKWEHSHETRARVATGCVGGSGPSAHGANGQSGAPRHAGAWVGAVF